MNRRMLFLARPFPPLQAISSVRTGNIAKHLAARGWDISVVTLRKSMIRSSIRDVDWVSSLRGITRIETGHNWKFLIPGLFAGESPFLFRAGSALARRIARFMGVENGAGWINPVLSACRSLQRGAFDVVLASGSPFMSFVAARKLAVLLDCALALDLRDPWTNSLNGAGRSPFWVRRLEAGLLRDAELVTTVSPSLAENIGQASGSRPVVIYNGFDPDQLARVVPAEFDHPAIVYAGSFSGPRRSVLPVMKMLRLVRAEVPTAKFHYYGPSSKHVLESARSFGVEDVVVSHGRVARDVALSAVAGALAAVVITSVNSIAAPLEAGVVTGKLFETMGLRTPVVLISPVSSDARAVVEHSACGGSFVGEDVVGMKEYVKFLLKESAQPSFRGVEYYSWPVLARNLDRALIDAISARARRG